MQLSHSNVDFCFYRLKGSSVLVLQLSQFVLATADAGSSKTIANRKFVLNANRVAWTAINKLITKRFGKLRVATQTVKESLCHKVQRGKKLVLGDSQSNRASSDLTECGCNLWAISDCGLNFSLQI